MTIDKKVTRKYDIIIVGGGMVGAAIAIGLAKLQYKVALIEQQALQHYQPSQAPDMRMSAFNMHSINLLQSLGAWQHILGMRFREYDRLSVWEHANTQTTFSAAEVNTDKLGYFVENRLIQLALFDTIEQQYSDNISCIFEQAITRIDVDEAIVELANCNTLQAKLVIGADGAQSQVRQAAKIATSGWQYSQHANAILIECDTPVESETWQEFHESGPRALLPLYDNYACLVWYDSAEQSALIQDADLDTLAASIKHAFPSRLPAFRVLNVAGFPLTRMHAKQYGAGKSIILGDAAHTINPLAGQGVNLGFKDVSALIEIISKNGINEASGLIKAFEKQRRLPNLAMMSTMDLLYATFSTPLLPIKAIRNLGLGLADKAGPFKTQVLKYAMGLD